MSNYLFVIHTSDSTVSYSENHLYWQSVLKLADDLRQNGINVECVTLNKNKDWKKFSQKQKLFGKKVQLISSLIGIDRNNTLIHWHAGVSLDSEAPKTATVNTLTIKNNPLYPYLYDAVEITSQGSTANYMASATHASFSEISVLQRLLSSKLIDLSFSPPTQSFLKKLNSWTGTLIFIPSLPTTKKEVLLLEKTLEHRKIHNSDLTYVTLKSHDKGVKKMALSLAERYAHFKILNSKVHPANAPLFLSRMSMIVDDQSQLANLAAIMGKPILPLFELQHALRANVLSHCFINSGLEYGKRIANIKLRHSFVPKEQLFDAKQFEPICQARLPFTYQYRGGVNSAAWLPVTSFDETQDRMIECDLNGNVSSKSSNFLFRLKSRRSWLSIEKKFQKFMNDPKRFFQDSRNPVIIGLSKWVGSQPSLSSR